LGERDDDDGDDAMLERCEEEGGMDIVWGGKGGKGRIGRGCGGKEESERGSEGARKKKDMVSFPNSLIDRFHDWRGVLQTYSSGRVRSANDTSIAIQEQGKEKKKARRAKRRWPGVCFSTTSLGLRTCVLVPLACSTSSSLSRGPSITPCTSRLLLSPPPPKGLELAGAAFPLCR
jgi:hypothetical protein